MNYTRRFKILKKLFDKKFLPNEDLLSTSSKTLSEEIIEEMEDEYVSNMKKIDDLELQNLLLDNEIMLQEKEQEN
ncbi:hypothetical protein [Kordia sp.]|uniref:hypothetical protein n=1 Tax=Kordia sp. TaxID=1965332 RepID=UPI0025BFF2AA|nr:hypothetical protein [Kordia sp.]MCH2195369.1 hypothetical protein [Kordia sp.]